MGVRLQDPSEPVTVEETEQLVKLVGFVKKRLMVGIGQVVASRKLSLLKRKRAARHAHGLESFARAIRERLEHPEQTESTSSEGGSE